MRPPPRCSGGESHRLPAGSNLSACELVSHVRCANRKVNDDLYFCVWVCFQKPGGLMFPDRAALYVVAIEDRQYKDFKIHCE